MRIPKLLPLLTGLLLVSAGCRTAPPPARPTQPAAWTRTELYFGAVAKPAWEEFLAEAVTPRFPDGFTLLEGEGQWRNPQGEIRRIPTRVLIILHPRTREAGAAVEAVRAEFLARFGHVSVLRGSGAVKVSF